MSSSYNSRRVRQGIGLLIALWALAFLVMFSTGVALSVPPADGGYQLAADSVQSDSFRLYVGYTDSTQDDRIAAAVNELGGSVTRNLRISKELSLENMAGVNGNLRIGIQAGTARGQSGTLTLKTQQLTADQVRLRGSVIDEDTGADVPNRFVVYAGNNPGSVAERDIQVETPGSQDAFEATNLNSRVYYVSADSIQLSNLDLIVSYDPDGDGEYEYGGG